eukprot:COSAG06_NODE_303_length_17863_cov_13.622326_7_plen_515_part_00
MRVPTTVHREEAAKDAANATVDAGLSLAGDIVDKSLEAASAGVGKLGVDVSSHSSPGKKDDSEESSSSDGPKPVADTPTRRGLSNGEASKSTRQLATSNRAVAEFVPTVPAAQEPEEAVKLDKRYKVKSDGRLLWNKDEKATKTHVAVEGRYCLVQVPTEVPLKNPVSGTFCGGKTSRNIIQLRNKWNKDNEPDFKYSNDVIYRLAREFVEYKTVRTQSIQKALFDCIPNSQHNVWEIPKDLQLDSTTLFVMRTEVCKEDPGLNELFSSGNLLDVMRHMTRSFKVNYTKYSVMVWFFLFPITDIMARIFKDYILGQTKTISANPLLDLFSPGGSVKELIIFIRYTTGKSRVFLGTLLPVLIWFAFAWTAFWGIFVYILWKSCDPVVPHTGCVPPLEFLHPVEPLLAVSYYIWACIIIAIDVSTELKYIPGNETWEIAYQKAEVSTTPVTLTKIEDGLQLTTTGMGLLHMVSRFHQDFEKEKDHESDLEEEEEEEEFGKPEDELFTGTTQKTADV